MEALTCTLTLTRRGSFHVEEVTSGNDSCQCGEQGLRDFQYTVDFCCCSLALDSKGFLVDQVDVHKAISNHFRVVDTLVSCELMSIELGKIVASLCPKGLKWVEAKVGNGDAAWMTARLTFEN